MNEVHRMLHERPNVFTRLLAEKLNLLLKFTNRFQLLLASQVEEVMRTKRGQPPVQGVINSGGVLADAVIPKQTAAGVRYISLVSCSS